MVIYDGDADSTFALVLQYVARNLLNRISCG